MAHENATPRPWAAIGSEKVVHRLDALTDLVVAEIETGNGSDAALIVEAVNAYGTLRAENERLKAAIRAILAVETHLLHCGYDDGPGGGNYVYKDVIRTDDEAFALARAALSEAQS
jgi:hypothetical protein